MSHLVSLQWLQMLIIFSCTCWPFVYLLWRTVYSGPLPIFFLWFSVPFFFSFIVTSPFFIWLLLVLLLSCRSSLYILGINPLSDIWYPIIFLPFHRSPFYSVGFFLCCVEVFSLMWSYLSVLAFDACAFVVLPKKSLPNPISWSFSLMLSSRSVIVLDLWFKSSTQFFFFSAPYSY